VLANNATIQGLELNGNAASCFPLIQVGQETPNIVVTGATITGNVIHDGSLGVDIQPGSHDDTVSQNEIFNTTGGIAVRGASNNTIQNNTFHNNGDYGIEVKLDLGSVAAGNQLLTNTISSTQGHGIRLE